MPLSGVWVEPRPLQGFPPFSLHSRELNTFMEMPTKMSLESNNVHCMNEDSTVLFGIG